MNLGKYIDKLLHVMSKRIENAFLISVAARIGIRRECVRMCCNQLAFECREMLIFLYLSSIFIVSH